MLSPRLSYEPQGWGTMHVKSRVTLFGRSSQLQTCIF